MTAGPGHLSWRCSSDGCPICARERIMVTHMNPTMLARLDEVKAAGVLVAEDGMVLEI